MNPIILRDPFETTGLRSMISNMFNEPSWPLSSQFESSNMPIDLSEGKEGETIVRAALPGFNRKDIDVSVQNGSLSITGANHTEEETKGEKFYRRECYWGAVNRRIPLPGNPSEQGVTAELRDGILTVKVPPQKGASPKHIEVR